MEKRKVSVIGLGKVGQPMVRLYATKGYEVLTYDRSGVGNSTYPQIAETDMSFVIVPTPSFPSGKYDIIAVRDVLEKLSIALEKRQAAGPHIVVLVSTVNPGDCGKLWKKYLFGTEHGLVYSPEFIRMGSVYGDLERPGLVLLGEDSAKHVQRVWDFYRSVTEGHPQVRYLRYTGAEIVKIAINSFLTVKVAFALGIQALTEAVDLEADCILEAIGLDSRIGGDFLRPGLGYGGPCLPRDNLALKKAMAEKIPDLRMDYLQTAADQTNEQTRKGRVRDILSQTRDRDIVGFLGLTYKAGTPLIEQSQGFLIYSLVSSERDVEVYDPLWTDENTCSCPEELLDRSDFIFFGTRDSRWERLLPGLKKPYLDPWYQG